MKLLSPSWENQINPNNVHPIYFHLHKVPWSIWGTLTWENATYRAATFDSEKLRQSAFNEFINGARAACNLRGKDFAFYHATEYGNADKCHLHFLLWNKRGDRVDSKILASTFQTLWNAGNGKVETYDPNHPNPAVGYCCKREFDANGCERERFDRISPNLLKWLAIKA